MFIRRVLCPITAAFLTTCTPTETPADCEGVNLTHAVPGPTGDHLLDCNSAECGNGLSPPTGGRHCYSWLPCRRYESPQQRCQWIHNLEHGHVVFAYNCPEGCPDVVNALKENMPTSRALLTPDPLIPKRVAVMLWGWSYSADEVDGRAIRCLLSHQDAHAPEPGLSCLP